MELTSVVGITAVVLMFAALYIHWRRTESSRRELLETCRELAAASEGLELDIRGDRPVLFGTYRDRTVRVAHQRDGSHGEPGATNHLHVQTPIFADLPRGLEIRRRGFTDRIPWPSGNEPVALKSAGSETAVVAEATDASRLDDLLSSDDDLAHLLDAFADTPELVVRSSSGRTAKSRRLLDQLEVSAERRRRIETLSIQNDGTAFVEQRLAGTDPSTLEQKLDAVIEAADAVEDAFGANSETPGGASDSSNW